MFVLAYPWCKEQVEVFVEQSLVLAVASTEVLQEYMGQCHDLIHLLITLGTDRSHNTLSQLHHHKINPYRWSNKATRAAFIYLVKFYPGKVWLLSMTTSM